MKPSTNLDGKRILVTGGARGLGADITRGVCAAGARVVIADILQSEGQAHCEELAGCGYEVDFVYIDLADPASIKQALRSCEQIMNGCDGLVNNAAIATGVGGRNFEDIAIDDWDSVMRVNVRGTWLVACAALPLLRRAPTGGRVVNIASDTALWGAPQLMHYVASKGAVIAMTRAMASELGASNICVNSVAPGLTRVEATLEVPRERYELYAAGRAISREQTPEDVTGAVLFLLADDAKFITGQLLPVNGGFVLN